MNEFNILHLRASNFYGGPERQLHFHGLNGIDSEFNITISSFLENKSTPEFLNVISKDNIKIHTFNVNSAYDLNSVGLIRDYLLKNKVTILCTHDYRTHFIGGLASKKTNTSWIAFSRGWTSENLKIKLFCLFDKATIRFADHIIAVSYSQKEKLKRLLIADKNITVVHNAIDPSAFNQIDPIDLKRKFNLPLDSIVGISGGRFSSEKGQRFLVYAAKIAINNNDQLKFILFGDGPDYQKIQSQIKSLNLQNHVFCPGFEKNLIGCLKGADFLVNPSLSEGLPNIVLEAMAMKIPCIATDVGGVGEIIENNSNGLLVPSQSPKMLADAILKIAIGNNLSIKFADNAYKTIIDRFSFDSQFEKLSQIYKSLTK